MKNNTIKSFVVFAVFQILLFGSTQNTIAQSNIEKKALKGAFKVLENCRWGKECDTLHYIDKAVVKALSDENLSTKLEEKFISILEHSKNKTAIVYACKQLNLLGTKNAVPSISKLLLDDEYSHYARYAILNIKDESASIALIHALESSDNNLKSGIINTLGERKEKSAVNQLIPLVKEKDKEVSIAAINALGKIGDKKALPALNDIKKSSNEYYLVASNAIIRIAEHMDSSNNCEEANSIYQDLYENGKTSNIKVAGLKGQIKCNPNLKIKLLLNALESNDNEIIGFVANKILVEADDNEIVKYVKALKKLPNDGKIALMNVFSERKTSEARAEILKLINHENNSVKIAAVSALRSIGTLDDISLLVNIAANEKSEEGKAARASLAIINIDKVEDKIITLLPDATGATKRALIDAISDRHALNYINKIKIYLSDEDDDVRKSVLEAIQNLGTQDQIQDIITFIKTSENKRDIRNAEKALTNICKRYGAEASPIVIENINKEDKKVQLALIGTLGLLGNPEAYDVAMNLSKNTDKDIKKSAIRSLCNWPDTIAIPELKRIKDSSDVASNRILAFRGYLRLVRTTKTPDVQKIRIYLGLVESAERLEEKRLALSAFGDIFHIEALKKIEKFLYDKDLAEETCMLMISISDELDNKYKDDIAVAMLQVLRITKIETTKLDAERRAKKFGADLNNYLSAPKKKTSPDQTKIVFIAGPMDHCGFGCHEYPKDLLLLKKCLDDLNMDNLVTEFYFNKIPQDLTFLDDADALIIHSSADRTARETHALFPNNHDPEPIYDDDTRAFYNKIDEKVKNGMGVMILHYALWTDNEITRKYMFDWIGGIYAKEQSKVKQDRSVRSLQAVTHAKPAKNNHPVLNGVTPIETKTEYYFNLKFTEDQKSITPLLIGMLPANEPEPHTIGWAFEKEGVRGIGFSGCHYHENLWIDSYRKFVINAIAWCAGMEIPKNGIETKIPEGWEYVSSK